MFRPTRCRYSEIAVAEGAASRICPECHGILLGGFESCKAVFEDVCAQEYADPTYGAVHLLTVDAYALQHSAERGPRSNAFHLMRLCLLLERGANPAIGQRPPREQSEAFETQYRAYPFLAPPTRPGGLPFPDVYGAPSPEEHARRIRFYAQSVWNAWADHHAWARQAATRGKFAPED